MAVRDITILHAWEALFCQACGVVGYDHIGEKCPFAPTRLQVPSCMLYASERERQRAITELIRRMTSSDYVVKFHSTALHELREYCPHTGVYTDDADVTRCAFCDKEEPW